MHKFTNDTTKELRYFLQSGFPYYDNFSCQFFKNSPETQKFLDKMEKLSKATRLFLFPVIYIISLFVNFQRSKKIFFANLIGIICISYFILVDPISTKIILIYLLLSIFSFSLNTLLRVFFIRKLRLFNKEFLDGEEIPQLIKDFLLSNYNHNIFQIIAKNYDASKTLVKVMLEWGEKTKSFDPHSFIKIKFNKELLIKIKRDTNSYYPEEHDKKNYFYNEENISSLFFNQQTHEMIFIYDFSSLTPVEKNNLTSKLNNAIIEQLSKSYSMTTLELSETIIEPFILNIERELNLNNKLQEVAINKDISEQNNINVKRDRTTRKKI